MGQILNNAIFWIETEKIVPNPYQPRREFDEHALIDLADSIRQYGILQPLTVTKIETARPNGDGIDVHYELIAGERRLRASRIAGLKQVPVVIRVGDDNKAKLELAIIENLQREDLNPIDRAKAFLQLAEEFNLTHAQIGKKMGKSREYVSNSLRLLQLPEEIMQALNEKRLSEGHTRALMMLNDRPREQHTLFKEIILNRMSVRETERAARAVAVDKSRKFAKRSPRTLRYQQLMADLLGTRVEIEENENEGGQIIIDYFTQEYLDTILHMLEESKGKPISSPMVMPVSEGHHPDSNLFTEEHPNLPAKPLTIEEFKKRLLKALEE